MSDGELVVQKVEWFQFRMPDGKAFFVMVSSLPNGFYTAVPVQLSAAHGDHSCIGLAASADDALAQLQANLAGKSFEQIFPAADH
jgi:hypothetical protein